MKALGIIETMGLVGAVEALDVALKTADVELFNKHLVKGGRVTIEIVGDVGAIKVAVEAGAEAAKRLGALVGCHVIARPDESVFNQMINKVNTVKETPVEPVVVEEVVEETIVENTTEGVEVLDTVEIEKKNKKNKKK